MKKMFAAALFLVLTFLSGFNLQITKAEAINQLAGITLEKAKQIALEKVKGTILNAKVEKEDGMTKYEIIVQGQDGKYEVEIDQSTGKVVEVEKEGAGSDKGHRHVDDDDKHEHDDDKHEHDDDQYDD